MVIFVVSYFLIHFERMRRRRSVCTTLTILTSLDTDTNNSQALITHYHDDICVPYVCVLSLLSASVDALISTTLSYDDHMVCCCVCLFQFCVCICRCRKQFVLMVYLQVYVN
jgi:hypothetical protein